MVYPFSQDLKKGPILVLRRPYLLVAGVVLLTVSLIGGAYYFQKFVLFGFQDIPGFVVMIETPTGTNFPEI